MKIAVIGRGNVGGGLADLWERAGHELRRIGQEAGTSLTSTPCSCQSRAARSPRPSTPCRDSRAKRLSTRQTSWAWSPQRASPPTAKSFNANFAAVYDRIGEAGSRPSNLWSGDEEARQVVEQLNREAGYEPVYAGPLENAAAQESFLKLIMGIAQGGMGQFLYRMAPPDQL